MDQGIHEGLNLGDEFSLFGCDQNAQNSKLQRGEVSLTTIIASPDRAGVARLAQSLQRGERDSSASTK